ncbi:docking domain of Afi1 for Arf3 in vesicle trafficking-domain-containing protein [Spinellus fusiger]|nr:docking domain of Afi1 for Arf3 in vesicle trafficking-domain-containing protein [Spinellus fusiger]
MTSYDHVQYILLAEFDIDKGASLKYQYPTNTGTDEHILSELMLPDGAHLRAEDWTIFCLNQMIPDPEAELNIARTDNEKPLLYVLNLVRTKHDVTARRGARVKAMAICTHHQFLHIYKPVLLLAMEKYFENPSREILESLHTAVNSMDLSKMPEFTWHERQILRASDNRTMFEEMFVKDDMDKLALSPLSPPLVAPETDREEEEAKGRRGTYIDIASGQMREISAAFGKDRRFFDTKIEYEGIKLPIRIPLTVNSEEVGDFSLIKLITTFSSATSPGCLNPHHPHLDSPGPYTHPIILLLNALLTQKRIVFLGYGHPSGEVANYVLAACALGSGCGTVLRGFTERAFPYTNLTSVDDLLKCPGFIAGVTNPTYEEHAGWWDVLCNISTGKITVSKDMDTPTLQKRSEGEEGPFMPLTGHRASTTMTLKVDDKHREKEPDHEFMADASEHSMDAGDNSYLFFFFFFFLISISIVLAAIHAHYGESSIRAKFQEYVLRFVRLAGLYEEEVYHQTKIGGSQGPESSDPTGFLGYGPIFLDENTKQREFTAYANRIQGWRQTISYKYYQKDFTWWASNSSLKKIDVQRQIFKLKQMRSLSDAHVLAIYEAFLGTLSTDEQVIEVKKKERKRESYRK